MAEYLDLPADMEVQETIVERELQATGGQMEIRLVKHGRQYEAAVFVNGRYRPGPPLPRPLENPAGSATHWMGIRPKVGLSAEEVEKIEYEVRGVNALYRITMRDTWGVEEE